MKYWNVFLLNSNFLPLEQHSVCFDFAFLYLYMAISYHEKFNIETSHRAISNKQFKLYAQQNAEFVRY